jgi:hypothetical protein
MILTVVTVGGDCDSAVKVGKPVKVRSSRPFDFADSDGSAVSRCARALRHDFRGGTLSRGVPAWIAEGLQC